MDTDFLPGFTLINTGLQPGPGTTEVVKLFQQFSITNETVETVSLRVFANQRVETRCY